MWDDVLDAAKRRRRATHALLMSGPAQVVDVRDNVIVLGFTTGPLERQFKLGNANEDVLREALKEVVGADFRIETTLAGGGSSPAASPSSPSPSAGSPPSSPASPGAAARSAPQRRSSARPAPSDPSGAGTEDPALRDRGSRRDASAPTPPISDEPDPDDDDADDGSSGLALLQRHLGATVIDDGETP